MEVEQILKDEMAAMRSHHLHVNYLVVVVMSAVLVLGAAMALHSEQNYQRMLGKAEEREARFTQQLKEDEQKYTDAMKQLAALEAQKQQVQTQIIYRDKNTDQKMNDISNIKDTNEAVKAVAEAYADNPAFDYTAGLLFGGNHQGLDLTLEQTKIVAATKFDRDRLASDLADTKKILGLEQQKSALSQDSLNACRSDLKDSKDVIDGYKKVAKRGKFRRFIGKLGDYVMGAGVGILLGKAL